MTEDAIMILSVVAGSLLAMAFVWLLLSGCLWIVKKLFGKN